MNPPPRPSADGRTVEERNQTESVLLPIRFPPGWIAAIDQAAAKAGKPRSWMIKEALRVFIHKRTGVKVSHRAPGKAKRHPAAAPLPPRKRRSKQSPET